MVTQRGKLLPLLALHLLFATTLCDVSHLKSANQQASTQEDHYHGQDGRYDNDHDGTGWDIRLSVPGEPERDYPLLNSIPLTSFNCVEKRSGYYADIQTRCQVFRVCAPSAPNGYFSFLCPNGTLFNQEFLVCDWWMNVKCVDTERYMDKNNYVTIKSGSDMMSDIEKMITYPMNNPYSTVLSNTKTIDQTYNPPAEMFEFMQQAIQNDMAILESFKLPGPNGELSQSKINKDSYTNGASFLGHSPISKKYEGAVPKLPNNFIYGNNLPKPFTAANFGGLSLQNQFNSNTKSIKVTKQQFTYPSQYDKEYTLTIPKADPSPQHTPTNIPATNTVSEKNQVAEYQSSNQYKSFNNESISSYLRKNNIQLPALTNIPKALPLIVLFLQPPMESKTEESNLSQLKGETKSVQTANYAASSSTNQFNDNTKDALTSTKTKQDFPNNFTANLASQTNYYITNNLSKPKATQPTVDPDVETVNTNAIRDEPARYTSENVIESFTNTSKEVQSFENSTEKIEHDNDLVTLFSAHIIPAGDVNKQKVLRICIPKDILSYLVHLHNSTKSAFFKAYQNEINSYNNFGNNTSIHIQGQPLIKRIMENFILKNQSSNLQVPNQSEENFYNQQQNPDGYFRDGYKNNQKNFSQFSANYSQVQFTNAPVQKTEQAIYSTSASFGGNENLKNQLSHYEENSKVNIDNHQSTQTRQETTVNEIKNYSSINSHYDSSLPKNENIKTENKLFFVNQQSAKFVPLPNVDGEFYSAYQQVYKQTPITSVHEKIINKEFTAGGVKNTENTFSVNSTKNSNQINRKENYNYSSNLGHTNSTFNFQAQRFGSGFERIQSTVQTKENQNNFIGNIVYADKQLNSANYQNKLTNQNLYKSTESSPNTSHEISHYIYTQYLANEPNNDRRSETEQKINTNIQNDAVKTVISSKYTNQNNNNNNMQYMNNFNTGSVTSNYNSRYQTNLNNNPNVQTLQYGFHEKNKHSNQINNNNYNTSVSGAIRHETRIQNTESSVNLNKNQQYTQMDKTVTQNMYYPRPQNQNPVPISPANLPPHLLINFDNLNGYVSTQSVQDNNKNAESEYHQRQQNIKQVQYPTKSVDYQISGYTRSDSDVRKNINNSQQPGTETVYTTVEVVPALGFSLNSEQERQHYYSVLAGGHKSNYKEAEAPYVEQQVMMYPQDTQRTSHMTNSQLNAAYNTANYAQQQQQQQQTSFVRGNHYETAYNSPTRNVHGHVVAHVTMQPASHDSQRQSLPLEDFGYPREKPNVAFMF